MRYTLLGVLMIGCLVLSMLPGCGGQGDADTVDENAVVTYGAISAKVRGMDPMDIGDTTSSGIASNIYDCLYQYHYLKRPYEIIPSLAADMPEVSDDGLTYTIRIRDDVFFQDDPCFTETAGKGRKLVAEDFIYSWKRLADIKNVSKNWWIFDGRIVGFDDFREYTKTVENKQDVDYSRPVEGLKALDDHTLQIRLTKPWPQIKYYLAHLPTAPVPREAVEYYGQEFINHPVGTGPYRLTTWRHGSKIILDRNPTFRKELYPAEGEPGDAEKGLLADAGKPLPLIDRIDITIIEEDQPLWLKFLAGDLDIAGIPKDSFDTAITPSRELSPEMRARGIVLEVYEDAATYWYGFNMEDPVLGKNLPLRQAMNLAINREEFLEKFLNNRGIPARGILPPMLPGYDPDINSPYTVYDPDLAKQKVKEAEQVHGGPLPTIVLTMGGTDTTARQVGQWFIRAYEKVGIPVDVEYMDWPSAQEKVKTKSAQMYAMGWVADIPDAENFMQLFYGPNASPGPNNMNYRNPQVDELYEKIAVMPDSPERNELVRQMQQMVVDDLPCVLTVHRVVFLLHYDWLKNYKPHVFGYGLGKYRNIDVALRRERVGR
ncbi:MAG: ABC transporter substrate-binding protein [Phycisphaeraceae bacterium]